MNCIPTQNFLALAIFSRRWWLENMDCFFLNNDQTVSYSIKPLLEILEWVNGMRTTSTRQTSLGGLGLVWPFSYRGWLFKKTQAISRRKHVSVLWFLPVVILCVVRTKENAALNIPFKTCACVCVWNVWIDVKLPTFLYCSFWISNFAAGGLEPICLPSPTKLWHFGGWVVWSTTCTCIFTSYAMGLSREPHPAILYDCRILMVISYLVIWIAICALQSNIQNSWHGCLLETSGKGFEIANFDLPHYYSKDYFTVDSFNSLSYLILHAWDQFPTDPIKDPFLV